MIASSDYVIAILICILKIVPSICNDCVYVFVINLLNMLTCLRNYCPLKMTNAHITFYFKSKGTENLPPSPASIGPSIGTRIKMPYLNVRAQIMQLQLTITTGLSTGGTGGLKLGELSNCQ